MKGENNKVRMKEAHGHVRAMTPDQKKALWDAPQALRGRGCAKCRYVGCTKCGQDID